jgi:hypothetical protein
MEHTASNLLAKDSGQDLTEAERQDFAEREAQPAIEKERQEAEQQGQKNLDKEAIAAIEETREAINAISEKRNDKARQAIERASAKINALLDRKGKDAFIPVDVQVEVFDTAPREHQAIIEIAQDAARALDEKDFPSARVLLHELMSEIRVRHYTLPLATFSVGLQDAARLLEQDKLDDANAVIRTALTTLVAIDHVTPVPLIIAREAIDRAHARRDTDKDLAVKLMELAKQELNRARELGYASKDPSYVYLNHDISELETQLKSGAGDTASGFSALKEKVAAFLKRQSDQNRH